LLALCGVLAAGCSGSRFVPASTGSSSVLPASCGTIAFPDVGGFSGTLNAPSATSGGGTSIAVADQTSAPTGLPALSGSAGRTLPNAPILYISLRFSSAVTFSGIPGFTITLPSAPIAGQAYYMATYGTTWTVQQIGPASISADTLTFASTSGSQTFAPGVYWVALYNGPAPTPAPTPTPGGPTPVAGPSGPVVQFTPFTSNCLAVLNTFAVQSFPSGLVVQVNGTAAGTTPASQSPAYSNAVYTYTIVPSNGAKPFSFSTDQTGIGITKTIFYNQSADTNGSIGSVSATAVTRRTSSQTQLDLSGTPRFAPFRVAGLPARSSTRLGVHYLVSALNMGGRHSADVERYEGVERAVGVGFMRNGRLTRVVDVPRGESVASLRTRLGKHAEVDSVEPLGLRYKTSSVAVTPNDPHFLPDQQWDMYRIGAPNAWGYTTGTPQIVTVISTANSYSCTPVSGIAIAIIDTGLDNTHPDLGPIGGVNKVVCGEKVVSGTITYGPGAAQDTDGHGTNVSGIAAADTNDGAGFAGTGYNVSLQIYKIFPDQANAGADTGDEAQAIYDAVKNGARVINLSLGGGQSSGFDPIERDAVEYAIAHNVVVVAAAGNEASTTLDYPGAYDGVISVGATSLNDTVAPKVAASATDVMAVYSNSGPRLTVVAPGGDPPACETSATPNCATYTGVDFLHWIYNIYTRTPLDPANSCSTKGTSGVVGSDPQRLDCKALFAGTSQATPHVAGAVALLLSKNPALTPAQVTQILESTADDIGDARQGHGRLNIYRALAAVIGDSTGLPLPSNANFVAFAYTNSGGTVPAIVDVTYPHGVPVNADGTFRLADIPTNSGTYHCAVWYDANGDGIVDKGDWFAAATVTGSGSSPCAAVTGLVVHPVQAGFTLP
jgi:subtilisin family serine protease